MILPRTPLPPKLELLVEDLETSAKNIPSPIPRTGTSHGGLCVGDWCMETNRSMFREYRLI